MQRYRRISRDERCQIFAYLQSGRSVSDIAELLNFHRSSIYRELSRNHRKNYDPSRAQKRAEDCILRCRRRRLLSPQSKWLRPVVRLLENGLAPDQIAGRIKLEKLSSLSHQTIYNEIYKHRPDLKIYLHRFGKKSGRGRGHRRKRLKPWVRSIHDRPKHILKREELGHWERDTMFGSDRKTLLVCLERKSRFVLIDKVKEPYRNQLTRQTFSLFGRANAKVLTLTNDNGNEFMDADKIEIPVYYCDPHSPHQKGSVENTIGLLRRDIKRTTDITRLSRKDLLKLQNKLNHRPRKCLAYRTPYEVMYGKTVALVT